MMRAAQKRGHAVWVCEQPRSTGGRGASPRRRSASRSPTTTRTGTARHETELRPLAAFRRVLMRKDPPFDLEYVVSTWLLSAAVRQGARVFNAPDAIRDHNEKLAIASSRASPRRPSCRASLSAFRRSSTSSATSW